MLALTKWDVALCVSAIACCVWQYNSQSEKSTFSVVVGIALTMCVAINTMCNVWTSIDTSKQPQSGSAIAHDDGFAEVAQWLAQSPDFTEDRRTKFLTHAAKYCSPQQMQHLVRICGQKNAASQYAEDPNIDQHVQFVHGYHSPKNIVDGCQDLMNIGIRNLKSYAEDAQHCRRIYQLHIEDDCKTLWESTSAYDEYHVRTVVRRNKVVRMRISELYLMVERYIDEILDSCPTSLQPSTDVVRWLIEFSIRVRDVEILKRNLDVFVEKDVSAHEYTVNRLYFEPCPTLPTVPSILEFIHSLGDKIVSPEPWLNLCARYDWEGEIAEEGCVKEDENIAEEDGDIIAEEDGDIVVKEDGDIIAEED